MDSVLSSFSSEISNQLWEQMPSPPKTRPPYGTWTWVKSQKQDDPEQK